MKRKTREFLNMLMAMWIAFSTCGWLLAFILNLIWGSHENLIWFGVALYLIVVPICIWGINANYGPDKP